MKPPDKNKCGMECIRTNAERVCVKPENGQCPRCEQLVEEALGRIKQLESTVSQVSKALCGKENATLDEILKAANQLKSRLAQAERERDALMDYLANPICAPCDICKHDVDGSGIMGCKRIREIGIPCFEWRGVCAENTKENEHHG